MYRIQSLLLLCTVALLGPLLIGVAYADSAPPTYQTTFYFQQQDGKPINQPIKFTMTCYGIAAFDESNTVLKISEYSATSKVYGSTFDTSDQFEAYRKTTKYCDISGEINGKPFQVQKFIGDSLVGLNCKDADYDTYDGTKYTKDGVDVTDKLPKNAQGFAFDKTCTVTVKIPTTISTNSVIEKQLSAPAETNTTTITTQQNISTSTNQDDAQTTAAINKPRGFLARFFASIGCFFKRLFGKSC